MLIDLERASPLTIDPSEYPTTLAIRLSVFNGDDHGFTGIRQGRHDPFLDHEREQPVPLHRNEDVDESHPDLFLPGSQIPFRGLYILDRPPFEGEPHLSYYRWYYAAIGFDLGVYVSRPYSYEIILQCCESQGSMLWSVSLDNSDMRHLSVILPDYQPGWRLRQ